LSVLNSFVKVEKAEMTLLGSPVLKGTAQDAAISHKIDELRKAVDRLSLLQSHDALVLLKNSLAMPKLLYTLRTSDCSNNPLLAQFDSTLRQLTCSSGCQWLYSGVMRSPSTALSPPTKRRCGLLA